jgi:hypothetical protein
MGQKEYQEAGDRLLQPSANSMRRTGLSGHGSTSANTRKPVMSHATGNKDGAVPAQMTPAIEPFVRLTPAEAASSKARRDARRISIKQQNSKSKM